MSLPKLNAFKPTTSTHQNVLSPSHKAAGIPAHTQQNMAVLYKIDGQSWISSPGRMSGDSETDAGQPGGSTPPDCRVSWMSAHSLRTAPSGAAKFFRLMLGCRENLH